MTLGEWMFYGGIAGFGILGIALVMIKMMMASKGKRLKARFDAEYGPEHKE